MKKNWKSTLNVICFFLFFIAFWVSYMQGDTKDMIAFGVALLLNEIWHITDHVVFKLSLRVDKVIKETVEKL